ncbi:MAG: Protein N-acetyltransferase, RimJ/RimL family [Chloroflexi bacterium]|nr:MAG: Protein N-acetyltransferase, RimJ/RimL family [Chloroflexota bacterium]
MMFKKAYNRLKNHPEQRPPTGGVTLIGEKVILREKKLNDALEDYTWRRDPELSKLDATRPISMSFADYHRYAREELRYDSYFSVRLAVDTEDGVHIGNCMYYDINDKRQEAELGIMIGNRDYWGQGYGSDAVKTLIDYVFTYTQLTKIYLHTLKENYRARKSFSKSGLTEIRQVKRSGKDFIRMEITKDAWLDLEKQPESIQAEESMARKP